MRSCSVLAIALLVCVAPGSDTPSALQTQPAGWVDLLAKAGPELKGWTRATLKASDSLKSPSQWSLDPNTKILLCQGDGGHEWLRWDDELADFVFHVEWRFTPVEGKTKGYNSGVYARNSSDAKTWHQAQVGPGPKAFLFGETPRKASLAKFNLAKDAVADCVKPPGEWNVFELTCVGDELRLWANGTTVCVLKGVEADRGFVGLEAEGWRIEFREVKLKPLAKP